MSTPRVTPSAPRPPEPPLLRGWEGAALMSMAAVMPFTGELYATLLALLAMVFLVALRGLRSTALVVPLPALLVVVWCGLSTGWSILPTSTLEAALQLGVLTMIGVWVAAGRDLLQLVHVFAGACTALLVASWVAAIVLPGIGRTQGSYETGSLEGVFVHRNLMGYFGVLAAVTFAVLVLRRDETGRRRRHLALLALSLATIFAAGSRTSWVVTAGIATLALGLFVIGRTRAPRTTLTTAVAAAAATAVVVGAGSYAVVVAGLGRDVTLTGRTQIWAAVIQAIQERPVTGYGWGAVWPVTSPISQELAGEVGFTFFHAHDGFLDSALQMGLVGLALSVAFLGLTLLRALATFLRNPGAAAMWPFLVLTAVTLTNLTETVASLSIGWVLAVAIGSQQLAGRWSAGAASPVAPTTEISRTSGHLRPTASVKGTP